ncbi:hypothetical protein JTB14_000315 [Gonioctena quinquepunctata]|nr:hypothetical protein JTB14_000315 [Gonioctena quinquepunctata]
MRPGAIAHFALWLGWPWQRTIALRLSQCGRGLWVGGICTPYYCNTEGIGSSPTVDRNVVYWFAVMRIHTSNLPPLINGNGCPISIRTMPL